jgi:hypothetical protein
MANPQKPLKTWVPDSRPTVTAVTLHGDFEVTAPLSAEHRAKGRELRDYRRRRGVTLTPCAEALGLTVSKLCECEEGERAFDMAEAVALIDAARPPES